MGVDGDYEAQRRAVHEAVVPVTAELLPTGSSWPRAARPADPDVDDAELVEDRPAAPSPIRKVADTDDRPNAALVGPVSITRQR